MPEEKKVDDRYVAICAKLKVIGEQIREDIFKTVEQDDVDGAVKHLDRLIAIDRCYTLSLQTGMKLVEDERKAKAAEEIENSMGSANN